MNADRHKVCEYLPHLQATRLAEKKMSAVEIVFFQQISEKSVDAAALSIDSGVQAAVETGTLRPVLSRYSGSERDVC